MNTYNRIKIFQIEMVMDSKTYRLHSMVKQMLIISNDGNLRYNKVDISVKYWDCFSTFSRTNDYSPISLFLKQNNYWKKKKGKANETETPSLRVGIP